MSGIMETMPDVSKTRGDVPRVLGPIDKSHPGRGSGRASGSAGFPRQARVGWKFLALAAVVVVVATQGCCRVLAGESEVFGPFFSHFSLTLDPGERTEIFGPFLHFEHRETESNWGISPLWFHRRDDSTDFEEFDFLYPLLSYDRFGEERRFQILQLFRFGGGANSRDSDQRQFTLFPFYFQQRSADPALNYTAVLPFYGRLKNRLLRDEVNFVMFPLYVQTRKRDVVTDNYVLPFFHLRHGNGLEGWQLWPIAGMERKELTTRTNMLDLVEPIGGHEKSFVLWPFFLQNKLGLGTTNVQVQQALLPFYNIQRFTTRDSTSILWPLGFSFTEDREKHYREWGAPWPVAVFSQGEGKTGWRIWPLFGEAHNAYLQSDFLFWPLFKYVRATSDPLDRERSRVFMFLYSDLTERNTQAKTALRRTDLWPLFTARRDHDGREHFQLFAPLEPVLANNKSIERNYSPLWSIWRSEKNPKEGRRSESFLWNFYRAEATATNRNGWLFFGLFQYQSDAAGHRWRLLGAPATRSQPETPGQSSPKP